MKKLIVFWLVVFVITFIVNSCGARKSDSHKKEETTKTDFSGFFRNSGNSLEFLNSSFLLQENLFSKNYSTDELDTDEFSVEPEDSTKPAIYIDPKGNKHVLVNSKLTRKKTSQKSNTKSENSQNSQAKTETKSGKEINTNKSAAVKSNTEGTLSEVNKSTKREAWSLWYLLWLIPPILLCLLAWKLWKKYKSKNPLV